MPAGSARRIVLGLVLAALTAGGVAVGQEEPAPSRQDARAPGRRPVELEEVTVTASPIVEGNEVDLFASMKTVVARSQLEDLNAQDLGTALRRTPGVTLSRYNPIGSFGGGEGGAVFIRGMGSSRPGGEIKMLIDGVPMYMSVWNHPLLDLMSIDAAGAVEVYKSPQPQHFGNAFGVVNLVPKRRETEGFRTRVETAVGCFETMVGTAEHGGRVGAFDYLVGGGWRRSDGHRTDADGRLADGYGTVGYRLSDVWELRLFTLWTDNRARDPGPEGAPPEERKGIYDTSAWLSTFTLAHETDQAEGFVKLFRNAGTGDWLRQPTATPGVTEDLFNDFCFYGLRAREALRLWAGGEVVAGLDWDFTRGDW
ncbi:MAG: TonB-dependent receptor plug domain-containing protein, partial [Planctomycetes bacterium]|nr:TonB-dependent receptor plug domain-containing protein [Planctomycetota bacterium]